MPPKTLRNRRTRRVITLLVAALAAAPFGAGILPARAADSLSPGWSGVVSVVEQHRQPVTGSDGQFEPVPFGTSIGGWSYQARFSGNLDDSGNTPGTATGALHDYADHGGYWCYDTGVRRRGAGSGPVSLTLSGAGDYPFSAGALTIPVNVIAAGIGSGCDSNTTEQTSVGGTDGDHPGGPEQAPVGQAQVLAGSRTFTDPPRPDSVLIPHRNGDGGYDNKAETWTRSVTVTWRLTHLPDRDHDGWPDGSDRCPADFGPATSGDGCPPPDADGDQVPDSADRCPGTPAATPVDAAGCSTGEPPDPGGGGPGGGGPGGGPDTGGPGGGPDTGGPGGGSGGSGSSTTTAPEGTRVGQLGRVCGKAVQTLYDTAKTTTEVAGGEEGCAYLVSNEIARKLLSLVVHTRMDIGQAFAWEMQYQGAVAAQDATLQAAVWDLYFAAIPFPDTAEPAVAQAKCAVIARDVEEMKDCEKESMVEIIRDRLVKNIFGRAASEAADAAIAPAKGLITATELGAIAFTQLDVLYAVDQIEALGACLQLVTGMEDGKLHVTPKIVQNQAFNTDVPGTGIVFDGHGNPLALPLRCRPDGLVQSAPRTDEVFKPAEVSIYADDEQPTLRAEGQPAAGRTVRLRGTGFAPSDDVSFQLHSTPVDLGSVKTAADGTLDARVVVPSGTRAGRHELIARGRTPGGTEREIVAVLEIPGGGGTAPVLPIALLAATLLGGGLTVRARRRRNRQAGSASA